jgi:hypothetical protein
VPSSTFGIEARTMLASPFGCSGSPTSMRCSDASYKRIPPSETSTGSLNRSEIARGDVSNLPPGCGSVVSRVACAKAGAAPATTNAMTRAVSASRRFTFMPAPVAG